MLLSYGPEEDGWLLVYDDEGGKAGYVPANYVEEVRTSFSESIGHVLTRCSTSF